MEINAVAREILDSGSRMYGRWNLGSEQFDMDGSQKMHI